MKQININMRLVKDKDVEKTRLKQRFDKRLLSDDKYCKAYKLDSSMFSKLMKGRVTGAKSKGNGTVAKIISRLKADGIWIGRLPWEK